VANEVTANAAVVQRHEDDGDWVGESGDYRFRIRTDGGGSAAATATAEASDAAGSDGGTGGTEGAATPPGTGSADPGSAAPATTPPGLDAGLPFADELARTGLTTFGGALAAASVLLITAGVVLLALRPRKRR
jgi:hypothetical protein